MKRPPKIALAFLRWFCRHDKVEEIEGDLVELFDLRVIKKPYWASIRFYWDVVRSFRLVNLKAISSPYPAMWNSHLKIGTRNLRKDYKFSLLNILGLAFGLSVFLVMIMMVRHEYSFDRFHQRGDRSFQVIQEFIGPQGLDPEIWTSSLLAQALESELPSVERAISVHQSPSNWGHTAKQRFFLEEGISASKDFFDFFSFPLKAGDPKQVLARPYSLVVTPDFARKIWGTEKVLGETLKIDRLGTYTVTGVMDDVPRNSTIQFDHVITQDYEEYFNHVAPWWPSWFQSWEGSPVATFVRLHDASLAKDLEQEINEVLSRHITNPDRINRHYLVNLFNLHFGLDRVDGQVNRYIDGDAGQIRLFIWIASAILIISVFNYVNLSTARAARRMGEVGVRKAMGSKRSQLRDQFLVESMIIVLLSTSIGSLLAFGSLPFFRNITGVQLVPDWQFIMFLLPSLLALILIVTVLAGFYPAAVLSKLDIITALRGKLTPSGNTPSLRNILVVVQFATVVIMLSFFLNLHLQYNYLQSRSMGFDTDQLLIVEINGGGVRSNFDVIKEELKKEAGIENVAGITRMIGGYRNSLNINMSVPFNQDESHRTRYYGMDEDGLSTLGLELIAGDNMSGLYSRDSATVILNERAAAKFGGNDIVGEYIELFDDESTLRSRVIGIVKDFHYESFHDHIGPVVIGPYWNPFQGLDDIVIRVNGADISATLDRIQEIHHQFDENDVMTWEFLDEMMQRAYQREVIFRKVLGACSILSLILALMGIVGMILHNAVDRTKEFGIRKILGATIWQLLQLQGRSLLRFVMISIIISVPIAWRISTEWLSQYAYRIELSPVFFLPLIFGVLLLSMAVITTFSWSLVRQNPINSLRYE